MTDRLHGPTPGVADEPAQAELLPDNVQVVDRFLTNIDAVVNGEAPDGPAILAQPSVVGVQDRLLYRAVLAGVSERFGFREEDRENPDEVFERQLVARREKTAFGLHPVLRKALNLGEQKGNVLTEGVQSLVELTIRDGTEYMFAEQYVATMDATPDGTLKTRICRIMGVVQRPVTVPTVAALATETGDSISVQA